MDDVEDVCYVSPPRSAWENWGTIRRNWGMTGESKFDGTGRKW